MLLMGQSKFTLAVPDIPPHIWWLIRSTFQRRNDCEHILGSELCDKEVTQFFSPIFDARFANAPVTFLYPESSFYI